MASETRSAISSMVLTARWSFFLLRRLSIVRVIPTQTPAIMPAPRPFIKPHIAFLTSFFGFIYYSLIIVAHYGKNMIEYF